MKDTKELEELYEKQHQLRQQKFELELRIRLLQNKIDNLEFDLLNSNQTKMF